MTTNELIALLRLQRIPNIGDVTAKKLIAHCSSAEAIFSDKPYRLQQIDGVGTKILTGIKESTYLTAAENEYRYIEKHQIKVTAYTDPEYPEYLKHCIDGPILLFQKGNIDLRNRKILSIVGTRKITGYGMALCERLLEDLAPLDPLIVSGFAYGVDICAQRAAVKQGLQTIGCLAHGLNQMYPKVHDRYSGQVMQNGGFVTEFWSSSSPERENFLKRNRIIAGMAEATVVIESAEKGGSLVTADIANSYDREVFAFPGRAQDAYSAGCNNLIKRQQAHMVTSAADIIYLLGWDVPVREKKVAQQQLFVSLDPMEQTIYDYLQKAGKQEMDQIALECKLPVFKTSSTLLNMEMKGAIRPLPGKLFEAV